MLRTNSSDVWRGGWKRQRGEGAPLGVSLPAAVCLCSPGFSFPCAALGPLLICLSAAGGHRPALSRLSGVSSCVSGESDTQGHPTPFADKVPPGHRGRCLPDSSAAECAVGCGVRPLRWSVPQVERTASRERWALSASRAGVPPGSRSPGAEEPLLRWAHPRAQLRHHVSDRWLSTHKLYSLMKGHIPSCVALRPASAMIYAAVGDVRKPVVSIIRWKAVNNRFKREWSKIKNWTVAPLMSGPNLLLCKRTQ